jgi:two-component system sensor histidine kinase/response regulator
MEPKASLSRIAIVSTVFGCVAFGALWVLLQGMPQHFPIALMSVPVLLLIAGSVLFFRQRRHLIAARRQQETDIIYQKQLESALRKSDALFQSVSQSANDAIIAADSSGKVIKWNAGAQSIFGYVESEAIGQPLTLLMPQRFCEQHQAGMSRVCAGGEPHVMGTPVELSGLRKDGSEFPLELSLAQWQIPEGHFFTGVIRDITGRKKIEQELENQKDHLEELVEVRTTALSHALEVAKLADRTKDAFLANMSHELRTPLNAVIGMAGLARNISTHPKQREYLDKIANSGKHLNRIINDLLDLSKIAAGHMEFETTSFHLRALLRHCTSGMADLAAEKKLELIEAIDEEVPDTLLGDPLRIEQILINLLGNAIKFTPKGRINVRVSVHAREENRIGLQIEIEDTGIGLRPQDIERLFKPFSQADATVSRQFGGTGLGLAISKRLAEIMGGDIDVSSREGSGSTFRVRIWLGVDTAAASLISEQSETELRAVHYRNAQILVVDDQALNREIVEALLTAVGIVPQMAENGEQALDILSRSGPDAFDLVLMDIQMPVMDGLAATRTLRGQRGFDALPIIAMTAHTMAHEKEIGRTAGMNDHIGKPFDSHSFYRTLAKWLPANKRVAAFDSTALSEPQNPVSESANDLSTLRAIDVLNGLARFNGKEDRYRYWLSDFAASAGSLPGQIRSDMAAGQPDAAERKIHAFKGRVGMLGMDELHGLFSALENVLCNGDAIDEQLAKVEQSIAEICDDLAHFFGKKV